MTSKVVAKRLSKWFLRTCGLSGGMKLVKGSRCAVLGDVRGSESGPEQNTRGWRICDLLARWDFSTEFEPELARRVAHLEALAAHGNATETTGALAKLEANREMLRAVQTDQACFSDPAWPRKGKICGGSKEISGRLQRFVKFYLGYAGAADYDVPRIGPPPLGPSIDALGVPGPNDRVEVQYSVRGWIGGAETTGANVTLAAAHAHLDQLLDPELKTYGTVAMEVVLGTHDTSLLPFLQRLLGDMKPGERRVAMLAPKDAYGDEGRGVIPSAAHLVVDITLVRCDRCGTRAQ
eukprot:gene12183-14393_t